MTLAGNFVCEKLSDNVLGSRVKSWFASSWDQSGDYGSYTVSCKRNKKSEEVSFNSSVMPAGFAKK